MTKQSRYHLIEKHTSMDTGMKRSKRSQLKAVFTKKARPTNSKVIVCTNCGISGHLQTECAEPIQHTNKTKVGIRVEDIHNISDNQ